MTLNYTQRKAVRRFDIAQVLQITNTPEGKSHQS